MIPAQESAGELGLHQVHGTRDHSPLLARNARRTLGTQHDDREIKVDHPNEQGVAMSVSLDEVGRITKEITSQLIELREMKLKLQELISTGCLWARIKTYGLSKDHDRIGMIENVMTQDGKLLLCCLILRRDGSHKPLWSESWDATRCYRTLDKYEFFTLENIGGKIQVPRMVCNGAIDGPCEIWPEEWLEFYTGRTVGEGAGSPHAEM